MPGLCTGDDAHRLEQRWSVNKCIIKKVTNHKKKIEEIERKKKQKDLLIKQSNLQNIFRNKRYVGNPFDASGGIVGQFFVRILQD